MAKFKKIKRNSLYFGRYQYVITISIHSIYYIKKLNHDQIDSDIEYYNRWRSRGRLTVEEIDNIHIYCDLLLSLKSSFKITVFANVLYVYTSDLDDLELLINSCHQLHPRWFCVNEAVVVYDKEFVYLKNSVYSYRSFLRPKELSEIETNSLANFFQSNLDSIRLNPRLTMILNYETPRSFVRRYIHNTDFVDHNDHREILMLNIILPNIVRKTFEIKTK